MRYIPLFLLIALLPTHTTSALTGPYAPGGQYNPIGVMVWQDPTAQYQQQFQQLEYQINLQAINEPSACQSYLAQARAFINTAITTHSGSPDQLGADVKWLQNLYEQNVLCIAQHPSGVSTQVTQPATQTGGTVNYGNMFSQGMADAQQACINSYGSHSVYGDFGSSSGYTCGCANGYVWNSSKTSCVAFPSPAQLKSATGPEIETSQDQFCRSQFGDFGRADGPNNCSCASGYHIPRDGNGYITSEECVPDRISQVSAPTTSADEFPATTTVASDTILAFSPTAKPARSGFWGWVLSLFGW